MSDSYLIFTDCHGSLATLLALVRKHGQGRQLISLGDEIDRGPRSAGVIEYMMTNKVASVASNHIDLCLAYSAHAKLGYKAKCPQYYERDIWLYNGGDKTLESYGLHRGQPLPKEVLDWMVSLPPYLVIETSNAEGRKLLASHTGFGLDADDNSNDGWFRTLWGRYGDDMMAFKWKDGLPFDDGLFRVFGHSRVKQAVIQPTHVDIDTGCAYEGYGVLTALKWPECEIVTQQNIDT